MALIQLWWAISFMAGAQGNGSGIASAGILGAGWAALTNGFPIVYCPPVCEEALPLSDPAHVGSIVFGILLPRGRHLVAVARPGAPGLVHAGRCGSLVLGTVVSLANTPITSASQTSATGAVLTAWDRHRSRPRRSGPAAVSL